MAQLSGVLALLATLLLLRPAAGECKGEQSYVFTIDFKLIKAIDASLPEKGDIPQVVVVSHKDSYTLFNERAMLDDTVAEVVENYRTWTLQERLDKEKDNDVVETYTLKTDVERDDSIKVEVRVKDSASKVSILAAIRPSPDWFLGLASYDLCEGEAFMVEKKNVALKTFDGGLDGGTSWGASAEPYDEGKRKEVGPVPNVNGNVVFAELSFKRGTLGGTNWWKILLGVLVGVAALIVLGIFVLPRFRKKRRVEIPLTAQDGVEW